MAWLPRERTSRGTLLAQNHKIRSASRIRICDREVPRPVIRLFLIFVLRSRIYVSTLRRLLMQSLLSIAQGSIAKLVLVGGLVRISTWILFFLYRRRQLFLYPKLPFSSTSGMCSVNLNASVLQSAFTERLRVNKESCFILECAYFQLCQKYHIVLLCDCTYR